MFDRFVRRVRRAGIRISRVIRHRALVYAFNRHVELVVTASALVGILREERATSAALADLVSQKRSRLMELEATVSKLTGALQDIDTAAAGVRVPNGTTRKMARIAKEALA